MNVTGRAVLVPVPPQRAEFTGDKTYRVALLAIVNYQELRRANAGMLADVMATGARMAAEAAEDTSSSARSFNQLSSQPLPLRRTSRRSCTQRCVVFRRDRRNTLSAFHGHHRLLSGVASVQGVLWRTVLYMYRPALSASSSAPPPTSPTAALSALERFARGAPPKQGPPRYDVAIAAAVDDDVAADHGEAVGAGGSAAAGASGGAGAPVGPYSPALASVLFNAVVQELLSTDKTVPPSLTPRPALVAAHLLGSHGIFNLIEAHGALTSAYAGAGCVHCGALICAIARRRRRLLALPCQAQAPRILIFRVGGRGRRRCPRQQHEPSWRRHLQGLGAEPLRARPGRR